MMAFEVCRQCGKYKTSEPDQCKCGTPSTRPQMGDELRETIAKDLCAVMEQNGGPPWDYLVSQKSEMVDLYRNQAEVVLSRILASQPSGVSAEAAEYVALPKKLTIEIACALEQAAPPPVTSQAAADQLVADYSTIWSHVIAYGRALPIPQQSAMKENVQPICDTYHSRAAGVACSNCGHPKEAHKHPSDTGAGK